MMRYMSLRALRQHPIYEYQRVENDAGITYPLPPAPFQGLDNEVHPVWRYTAWREYTLDAIVNSKKYDSPARAVTTEFYGRIKPALQLATILLDRVAPIMVRIVRAPMLGNPGQRMYDPDWEPTTEDYAFLDQELQVLATRFRIFSREPMPPDAAIKAMGEAKVCIDESAVPLGPNFYVVHCALAAEILDEIDADRWRSKSPLQRASILTLVAFTLVHELAHSLEMRRRVQEIPRIGHTQFNERVNENEPMVFPWPIRELGSITEYFLWGTSFRPRRGEYMTRWDIEAGLTQAPTRSMWNGTGGLVAGFPSSDRDPNNRMARLLSDATLFSFFDKRTWTNEKVTLCYTHEYEETLITNEPITFCDWPFAVLVGAADRPDWWQPTTDYPF